jgi:hypothetical protein
MRRTLGTLLATVALAVTTACGSSTSSTASDDPPTPSDGSSWPPGPIADANVLPLISLTGGGGHVSVVAAPLDSGRQIAAFSRQFRAGAMEQRIRALLGDELKAPDHDIVGAVVAVGCDRPPGVDVVANATGQVELVPHEVASPLPECLAAVTTVAIAVLPRN